MSHLSGALPGTILTASLSLKLTGLGAGASGLATISLADVKFNENDDAAVFSVACLRVTRMSDLIIELLPSSDTLEPWVRRSVIREVRLRITNISTAAITRNVPLALFGYPPAPVPNAADFTRVAALLVANTGAPVEALNQIGSPISCNWLALAAPSSPGTGDTPSAISKAGGTVFVDDVGRPWTQSTDGVFRVMRPTNGATAQVRVSGVYITAGLVGDNEFLLFQALEWLQFQTNNSTSYIMRDAGMGINTNAPTAQLDVRNSIPSQPGAVVRAASGQSAFTLAAQSSEGTIRSGFNKTQDLEFTGTRSEIHVDRTTGERVKWIYDNGKIVVRSLDGNNNETATLATFSPDGNSGQQ